MALDHANWFIAQKHPQSEMWGGSFPVYHNTLSFLTRFVTHMAAPGFFFLMGAGMLLFTQSRHNQDWDRWKIIRHFILRGGFLIALQLLVINRAWELSPEGWLVNTYIGVLFALGGCMILGSLLVWLQPVYLLALTIVLFIGIELFVPDPRLWGQIQYVNISDTFNLLLIHPGGTLALWSNYPILPWLELVTFGMVFGNWLLEDQQKAFNRGLKLGVAFLFCFVIIRLLDGFGNIRPRMGDTWIDYLNVVKYPPSMTFTFMTMGINLIVLWLFARVSEIWSGIFLPLAVYGRAPLFFYILHLFLYAWLGQWSTPNGTSIPVMYLYWLFGLLLLFPVCFWYTQFKQRQPANSILRFL